MLRLSVARAEDTASINKDGSEIGPNESPFDEHGPSQYRER